MWRRVSCAACVCRLWPRTLVTVASLHTARCCSVAASTSASSSSGSGAAVRASAVHSVTDDVLIPGGTPRVDVKDGNDDTHDDKDASTASSNVVVTADDNNNSGKAQSSQPSSDAYAPWEVRALVLSLLPPDLPGSRGRNYKEVLYALPTAVRLQLQKYEGSLHGYVRDHLAHDIVMRNGYMLRASGVTVEGAVAFDTHDAAAMAAALAPPPPPYVPPSAHASRMAAAAAAATSAAAAAAATPPPSTAQTTTDAGAVASEAASSTESRVAVALAKVPERMRRQQIHLLDQLVPYVPTFFVDVDAIAMRVPPALMRSCGDVSLTFVFKRLKHYFDIRTRHGHTEVRLRADFAHPQRGAADASHTAATSAGLDAATAAAPLMRASVTGDAGDAGAYSADGGSSNSSSSSSSGDATLTLTTSARRSLPMHAEARLVALVVPRLPRVYTPLAEVLRDVSDLVARHPAFDARLGIAGLFDKYPEYIQQVGSTLRVRPYRSAPHSIADHDASTSPLPHIFAKVWQPLATAAAGVDYGVPAAKEQAMVPTGMLYALLSAEEKREVKATCRSFLRFLRMHGKVLVVTADTMRVYLFRPEYEPCADTLLDERLLLRSSGGGGSMGVGDAGGGGGAAADGAQGEGGAALQVPASMEGCDEAAAAVRALYDALPLTQCAELADVLSLVTPSVREALPRSTADVAAALAAYPAYFATWTSPDDAAVIVVMRAKVDIPNYALDEVARIVLPLVPATGVGVSALLRRVPLPLQRYLYRHGVRTTLRKLHEYFVVHDADDRVTRVQ